MTIDAWEMKALEGRERIKKSRVKKVDLLESEDRDVEKNGVRTYSCDYDEKARIVKESEFGLDGALDWSCVYKYDDKDNLIEETVYTQADVIDEKFTFEYDATGNRVKALEYDSEDQVGVETAYKYENGRVVEEVRNDRINDYEDGKIVYKYDSKGNKTEIIEYDPAGNVFSKVEFKYNPSNCLMEEVIFTADDEEPEVLIVDSKIAYVYDQKDRMTERIITAGDVMFEKVKYSYNEDGNIIEEFYFERDTPEDEGHETKMVYEYDANGNMVSEIEYDSDGDAPLLFTRYAYEYYA